MPTLSASDYTRYLKLKSAATSYANGAVPKTVQTTAQVVPVASILNAEVLASQAAQTVAAGSATLYASGSTPFTYTGSDQTFVVPPTVYTLQVTLSGAGGETATDGSNQGDGGAGGYVTGTLPVSPGELLTVVVGGKTGYGGGGAAGAAGAGRGGGRTAIRRGGVDIVTAGGGGGGGQKTQGGAGGGASGVSGAAFGGVSTPVETVVDSVGNLFIANFSRHTILKVTPAGAVSVFAGADGTSGSTDATGGSARFNQPQGLAIDSSDNLYVGDAGNFKIRKITSGAVVTTLAGSGSSGSANADGTSATFNTPVGLAIVGTTLYIADQTNNKIRAMTLASPYTVTSPYGSGTAGGNNANGTSATFNAPYGITTDGTDLYVSDATGNRIRKITLATTAVTTIAGSGTAGSENNDGTSATFSSPRGLAVTATAIYVADSANNSIRAISLTSPFAVTTYSGAAAGWTGTTVSTARYTAPLGVTHANGVLYVSDGNNLIRKIVIASGVVSDLIVDATGGTQSAVGTGGTGAGAASGTTGGAGKTGDQAGGGGGGYFGGGGGTTNAAGAGGSSFIGGLQGATLTLAGGGAASNTDGSATFAFTYAYKEARPVQPARTNNPNALSTVSYAGTSGALSSSRNQQPGGLPTGFKSSTNTYTRLPQNAGWIQGTMLSSGPKRF
jgi:hypothetical protein